jgi:hypothetical protein
VYPGVFSPKGHEGLVFKEPQPLLVVDPHMRKFFVGSAVLGCVPMGKQKI